MKKVLRRLKLNRFAKFSIILLLTFITGISAAKIYFAWIRPFQPESFASVELCKDGSINFAVINGWQTESGLSENGQMGLYEVEFESSQAAQKCFQAKLQSAFRVVEEKPLFDESRKSITGKSFTAVHPPTPTNNKDWVIITSLKNNKIRQFYQNSELKLTSDR